MEVRERAVWRVSGPGEGLTVWFRNNRITFKATAESTGGSFGLWEAVAAPGDSPPLHIHHADDESFFLIEGRMTVRCGVEEYEAGPGAFVFLPRGVPHTFRIDGDTAARFLGLLTPGGGERFFVDAGRPAAGPGLPPETPPDIESLKRAGANYGLEIVGPPMPARETR